MASGYYVGQCRLEHLHRCRMFHTLHALGNGIMKPKPPTATHAHFVHSLVFLFHSHKALTTTFAVSNQKVTCSFLRQTCIKLSNPGRDVSIGGSLAWEGLKAGGNVKVKGR